MAFQWYQPHDLLGANVFVALLTSLFHMVSAERSSLVFETRIVLPYLITAYGDLNSHKDSLTVNIFRLPSL